MKYLYWLIYSAVVPSYYLSYGKFYTITAIAQECCQLGGTFFLSETRQNLTQNWPDFILLIVTCGLSLPSDLKLKKKLIFS